MPALALFATDAIAAKIALASDSVSGMILAVAIGAFSSVGRAIARQAMGHRFESCNAHHLSGFPGRSIWLARHSLPARRIPIPFWSRGVSSDLRECLRGALGARV